MIEVIVGNICSVGAMISDSYGGTRKTKKGILLAQCISQIFYMAAAIILKGYSAAVQNVVAIFRNTYAVYGKHNKIVEWSLVAAPVVLGLVFNNRGWLGVLPVVANLQYSITMVLCKDDARKLKISLVAVSVMFSVFNFAILNFVSGVACIVTGVVTTMSIVKNKETESSGQGKAE